MKYEDTLKSFLHNMSGGFQSKQALMDAVTRFVADYLRIPASYIAIKRTVEEEDVLYYYSSNQPHVVGQTLKKAEYGDDDDEPSERLGVSFEAFVVPESEEEVEPPEDAPEGWTPPDPKLEPFVVDNVMRDRSKRVKFFGVPRLGSYVAIPLKFQSSDHEDGCELQETEEEEAVEPVERQEDDDEAVATPAITKSAVYSKRPVELLLCADTIGDYQSITRLQKEVLSALGQRMVSCMEEIEAAVFQQHVVFLTEALKSRLGDLAAALAEEETQGTNVFG
jgi:hypothetical protein